MRGFNNILLALVAASALASASPDGAVGTSQNALARDAMAKRDATEAASRHLHARGRNSMRSIILDHGKKLRQKRQTQAQLEEAARNKAWDDHFHEENTQWQQAAMDDLKQGKIPQEFDAWQQSHGGSNDSGSNDASTTTDQSSSSDDSTSDDNNADTSDATDASSGDNTDDTEDDDDDDDTEDATADNTDDDAGDDAEDDDDADDDDDDDADDLTDDSTTVNSDTASSKSNKAVAQNADTSSTSSSTSFSTKGSSSGKKCKSKSSKATNASQATNNAATESKQESKTPASSSSSSSNSGSSGSSSGSGSSSSGGLLSGISNVVKGKVSYYSTGLGACGWTNKDSDYIAALPQALAYQLGGQVSNGNIVCGKKVKISNGQKEIEVEITDFCPGCDNSQLDLSPAAFSALGEQSRGILPVSWGWVGGEPHK